MGKIYILLNLGITIFRKGCGWGGCATFGGLLLLRLVKRAQFFVITFATSLLSHVYGMPTVFQHLSKYKLTKDEADEI